MSFIRPYHENSYGDPPSPVVTNKEYEIIQINGTRVYGPPTDYYGPIPTSASELFLQNIPRHLTESDILPHFERFGLIYEFRLMMDYDNSNRGYAFLKYTAIQDAVKAMDVMNHYIFENGMKLMIRRSYNKCRLYVGKFPKTLTYQKLDTTFRQIFPTLHKFDMYTRQTDGGENPGYGILEFSSHKDALEAKKRCTPGGLDLFGTTLDISWDKHNRCQEDEELPENKTLFVRNIHPKFGSRELSNLLATRISNADVKKISRTRDLAFIDFNNHEAAEVAKDFLNGYQLYERIIDAEWAMPPKEDSIHFLNNCDCDAILRMKCIANNWDFPTILLGRYFSGEKVQCGALMTKSKVTRDKYIYFFEISTLELSDLQSRLCEIVIHIIKLLGGLPGLHLVIRSYDDTAEIIGHIPHLHAPQLMLAQDVDLQSDIHWNEIADLSRMVAKLAEFDVEHLYSIYSNKLQHLGTQEYIDPIVNGRICGCLSPAYRNRPPLKHGLDNRCIVLILCDLPTGTNYVFDVDEHPAQPMSIVAQNHGDTTGLKNIQLQLFPRYFVQNHFTNLTISKVLFGQKLQMPRTDFGAPSLDCFQFSRLSIGSTPSSSMMSPESVGASPTQPIPNGNWYQPEPMEPQYRPSWHNGGEYGLLRPVPMTPQVSPTCPGQYLEQYQQQKMTMLQNLQYIQEQPSSFFELQAGCFDQGYGGYGYPMNH